MQHATPDRDRFREELNRILASETLRSAESLRRLLGHLGEAYERGTSRELKEYTIGRDAMGKPEDYDPRVDASVRVQIGKLRQRLEQYYREEAPEAPYRIQLPKGHFELTLEPRAPEVARVTSKQRPGWRWVVLALGVVVLLLGGTSAYFWQKSRLAVAERALWTPEMREFWGPYLDSRRPVMVVLGTPLFVRFHSYYFRNPWANEWEEVERKVPLEELRKLLKSPTAPSETHRWTPFGEAMAAFRLAAVLSPVKEDMVMKRSTVLAWEDVRGNNLVFLGPPKFNPQLTELPVEQDFVIGAGMVRNLRPRPGEEREYSKPSPPEAEEIPEDYAVITRVRGVEGWGEILVLASTSTEGTWAAADYVTRPLQVKSLLERLRGAEGSIPASYQVLVKCRFKAQVPIQTDYVTHHVLRARGAAD